MKRTFSRNSCTLFWLNPPPNEFDQNSGIIQRLTLINGSQALCTKITEKQIQSKFFFFYFSHPMSPLHLLFAFRHQTISLSYQSHHHYCNNRHLIIIVIILYLLYTHNYCYTLRSYMLSANEVDVGSWKSFLSSLHNTKCVKADRWSIFPVCMCVSIYTHNK